MRDFLAKWDPFLSIAVVLFTTVGFAYYLWHFWKRRQLELEEITVEMPSFETRKEPAFDDSLKTLITRDDVTLRILEEIYAAGRFYTMESRRAISLIRIQRSLRIVLRDAVKADNFEQIRDKTLRLLDEAQKELDLLQQRKPFEGLEDPEKSLLVDLVAEIPADKIIPRQKALQLADIIKIKHQDIRNLQVQNARSAAWTRWGTFGTISFGLLSIILSIYTAIK